MTQLEIALPTKEQIEKRAYEFYLARHCEPGRDLEDWLAAERELTLEHKLTAAMTPARNRKGTTSGID